MFLGVAHHGFFVPFSNSYVKKKHTHHPLSSIAPIQTKQHEMQKFFRYTISLDFFFSTFMSCIVFIIFVFIAKTTRVTLDFLWFSINMEFFNVNCVSSSWINRITDVMELWLLLDLSGKWALEIWGWKSINRLWEVKENGVQGLSQNRFTFWLLVGCKFALKIKNWGFYTKL